MGEGNIEGSEPRFNFPSLEREVGEIERVQAHFQIKDSAFVQKFIERAQQSQLVKLSDEVWNTIENTDSHSDNILRGDWETVAQCAAANEVERDWYGIRSRMQRNESLYAPIVARRREILHLVSGNTRLMVARALGARPDVLIVDVTDFE